MRLEKLSALARPLVLGTAIVLFVDLFLDWRVASVTTPAVTATAGASGWAGWGVVAGILLAALIVWELRLLRRGQEELRDVTISTALALGAAGFVVVAFVTGAVSVEVAGVVAVSTEEVRWPGYFALVLAGLLAVAAVVRHLAEARAHPAPPRTTAHGAV